jgi:hypothetical protein
VPVRQAKNAVGSNGPRGLTELWFHVGSDPGDKPKFPKAFVFNTSIFQENVLWRDDDSFHIQFQAKVFLITQIGNVKLLLSTAPIESALQCG